jgi:outer membrane protein OmpA-like peptidoglycan-associated protein
MSKRLTAMFCLAGSLLIAHCSLLHASFEEEPTGGRATGLDGAMTATSDDVFSLYYNPAGAVHVKKPEVAASYGSLYQGLSDGSTIGQSFVGYVHPLDNQVLGISYNGLSLNNLYRESVFGLSYARPVNSRLAVGGTLKYYQKHYGTDSDTNNSMDANGVIQPGLVDPVFKNGSTAGNFGGDLGALYQVDNYWTLGAMVANINEANVSLGDGSEDRVPRAWKLGIARALPGNSQAMIDFWEGRFTTNEARVHGGYEKWFDCGFGVRAGGGIGENEYRHITTGFSYRWSWFQIDYGFMMPLGAIEGTAGVHEFSLMAQFGGKSTPKKAPKIIEGMAFEEAVSTEPEVSGSSSYEAPVVEASAGISSATTAAVPTVPVSAAVVPAVSVSSPSTQATEPLVTVSTAVIPVVPTEPVSAAVVPAVSVSSPSTQAAEPSVTVSTAVIPVVPTEPVSAAASGTLVIEFPGLNHVVANYYETLKIHFDPGCAGISSDQSAVLVDVAERMKQNPGLFALVEGYADDSGSSENNLIHSQNRAELVRGLLIDRFGVAPERIKAVGYGSQRPIASNRSPEGRSINRRVAVLLLLENTQTKL